VNSVIGTVGATDKQDWIALTIPAGFQLSSDVLESYSSTDAQGFSGVQAGSSFVGSVNNPASYLGYTHFGTGAANGSLPATNLVGVDLLPLMGDNVNISAGSTGFTPPLPSGTYTFLIQQLGATTSYQFDYGVTSVPEPTTIGLIAGGALLALRRRSRRA
ncbi:MAG TPA: PEP-CTERM sorting domain-containing protein, partial [Tepidisphaeraceae bacterium]